MSLYEIASTLVTAKAIIIGIEIFSVILKIALVIIGVSLLKMLNNLNKMRTR